MPKPTRVREQQDPSDAPNAPPAGAHGAEVEVTPKSPRRRFTASEKLRIVKAAEAALASGKRGELEALLRREGIYSSHLSTWRAQLASQGAAGLTGQKPGRKPKLDAKDRKLLALEKRNAELERRLAVANALVALQKKAHEVLGIALPTLDEDEVSS